MTIYTTLTQNKPPNHAQNLSKKLATIEKLPGDLHYGGDYKTLAKTVLRQLSSQAQNGLQPSDPTLPLTAGSKPP